MIGSLRHFTNNLTIDIMAGHYFKTKQERMQAFYNCILALWSRAQAGNEINPSVVIDRFHIGHIKMSLSETVHLCFNLFCRTS